MGNLTPLYIVLPENYILKLCTHYFAREIWNFCHGPRSGNLTPCMYRTPEHYILKLCTHHYVREATHHANFGFNRLCGASPQISKILLLCDFSDCPVLSLLFFGHAPMSNRRTNFYALRFKGRVSAHGNAFWGLERWVTTFREIFPQNLPKWAGIGNF